MVHREDTWNLYQIQAGQVDAVLAQLMLLYQHVRCVVDPKFYGDEVKKEVRLWIMSFNGVM